MSEDEAITGVDDLDATPRVPVLVVLGDGGPRRFPLNLGRNVIGRGAGSDIVLSESAISRQHAALSIGEKLVLEDLGSANGTHVGGTRIDRRVDVAFGDVIHLGSVAVIVMRDRDRAPPSLVDTAAGPVVVDPRMRAIVQVVERIAAGNLGVLVTGESGTGKEVIAELLHARSARASGPFVAINCATLPEGLVEDELFGHGRGAFTGATHQRRGLFEEADGGTLFLDEIGELAPATQAKLLRVLEDHVVRALGGGAPVQVDVRVVTATHRDLRGTSFRTDLYHRLAGIVIDLPALRDRRADILPLAARFLSRAAITSGRSEPALSDPARAWLMAQAWPGNIRELRNAIDRAVLLCEGAVIEIEHLTGELLASEPVDASLRSSISDVERVRIQTTLDDCDWNQSEAARRLKISRNKLAARIKALALRR